MSTWYGARGGCALVALPLQEVGLYAEQESVL